MGQRNNTKIKGGDGVKFRKQHVGRAPPTHRHYRLLTMSANLLMFSVPFGSGPVRICDWSFPTNIVAFCPFRFDIGRVFCGA